MLGFARPLVYKAAFVCPKFALMKVFVAGQSAVSVSMNKCFTRMVVLGVLLQPFWKVAFLIIHTID